MASDLVYLNGKILPRSEALVPVEDRGFVFGDGVYEVLRVVHGRFFAADFHNERLKRSLAGIRIEIPANHSPAKLNEIAAELLKANSQLDGEATVYMQVTRGVATRAHAFPSPAVPPTVYISTAAFKPMTRLQEDGTLAVTHPDLRWARCDYKTINLLPNILASQYAAEQGATEAILIRDDEITEGAKTNVFGVLDGALRTHPCNNHILPGITRSVVETLAADLNVEIDQTPIKKSDIPKLQELFLSGTTTDVMPVVALDGKPVGSGKPGPITRRLQKILNESIYSSAPLGD